MSSVIALPSMFLCTTTVHQLKEKCNWIFFFYVAILAKPLAKFSQEKKIVETMREKEVMYIQRCELASFAPPPLPPASRRDAPRQVVLPQRAAGQEQPRHLHQGRQEEHQAERRGRRRARGIKVSGERRGACAEPSLFDLQQKYRLQKRGHIKHFMDAKKKNCQHLVSHIELHLHFKKKITSTLSLTSYYIYMY